MLNNLVLNMLFMILANACNGQIFILKDWEMQNVVAVPGVWYIESQINCKKNYSMFSFFVTKKCIFQLGSEI